jgi:D-alanine transaminase
MVVYLNGDYVDHSEARVSVDDRGFLFADGIYEVIRIYGGRPFLAGPHMERMARGLAAISIDPAAADGLLDVAARLIAENAIGDADATVYMQITRGAAPRRHAFPEEGTPPTVYAAVKPYARPAEEHFTRGVAAITTPDTRWGRCDIKSIALLPNVLANQKARASGAFEALFVRDGVLIEGSHSNLIGVVAGHVVSYPECNYILGGITRRLVLDLARELGLSVREAPIWADRLDSLDELFLSGTTTEVMPITRLDGRPVSNGQPGPVARALQQAYLERATVARAVHDAAGS